MDNIVDYGKSKVKTKKCSKKKGRTRIRTGVAWIKTKSDNHYTIQPFCVSKSLLIIKILYSQNNARPRCPCEHFEPTTQSPIRHVLNDCRITTILWDFLHDDSPRPNLVCPELNTIQLHHFVGYLFYAHQMSYSRSINHEDPIDWSDEDELALLHHHYTSCYPDD
jgi:hypothetical protein